MYSTKNILRILFVRRIKMSSISNQPAIAGQVAQKALSDAKFSSYVREKSVSAYESLEAGLKIQTKEGDVVTLTSSSYAGFNAYMYNSRGILQTESGSAVVKNNQREITLESGETFSFSVSGDLSEEELADIENIVREIDEIISEMAQGDMEEAVEKAVAMGDYDTVSMYAADLSYQRTYSMASEIKAAALETAPATAENNYEILPEEETILSSAKEPFRPYPENRVPRKQKANTIRNISQFVERMAEKLEKHEDKLAAKARQPVEKLFQHHLNRIESDESERPVRGRHRAMYNAVENTGKKIDKLIDKLASGLFHSQFKSLV